MSVRFLLSALATVAVFALGTASFASGPCTDAGCWPDGGSCELTSCTCSESGGCNCTYYCDSNDNGYDDARCDLDTSTSDLNCTAIPEPRPVIITE